MIHRWNTRAWVCALLSAALAGCAGAPPLQGAGGIAASPWAIQSEGSGGKHVATGWRHLQFPGKRATRFEYARTDGRDAVSVTAVSSASMLRSAVRVEPADLGGVNFSWKVPQLIPGADMALREADDSPVRVVLVFEGDRSRFSARDAMLSELIRTLTGEEMPYATLMYVWCNKRASGSLITSPRTDRIRKLVVESGPLKLNQWLDYRRNIAADFQRAFGEPPGALVGIGIMSDSDNTKTTAQAWYGPVRLVAVDSLASSLRSAPEP
jgi:hypothetical protein